MALALNEHYSNTNTEIFLKKKQLIKIVPNWKESISL